MSAGQDINWTCQVCGCRNSTPRVLQGRPEFVCVGCKLDTPPDEVLAQYPPSVTF